MANKRIEYIDNLKFIAILAVIVAHALSLIGGAEVLHFRLAKIDQLCRFAVPLFLMITGALFLNKDIILKDYLKKRVIRVIYPLIFFTVLIYISKITNNVLYYYWYSWMIIGVLLAVPIINKFIQHSNEKEIEYYIIIFIIFSIFNQVCNIYNIKYALDISFFYTPVSYLILGYYLFNKKTNTSPNKLIILSVVLFIITSVIKMKTGNYNYSHEFHTYLDLSLLQIIQVTSVFIFIKSIYDKKGILYKFLEVNIIKKFNLSVSRASYGMYLVQHPIIFGILPPLVKPMKLTGTQSFIFYIITVITVFIISWLLVLILSKIPFIKKFSGYY
ncbi:acyltransferase [uncultured Methanobrevibacter sp.]|uniref:acyltransferase n=1 Tax=uncultured Methanobrevibacter sp. TaxID=253161 RepID=UPI0025CEDDEA|nr:acyltransferase family protein [uncultured Methanobrevibacter sp.]